MTFQEYATGESLDTMIRNYLDTQKGLSEVCQAYFLMGKALAELQLSKIGPRAPMHPIFEDSARHFLAMGVKFLKENPEYKIEIKKIDVDKNQEEASKYGVMSIPTYLILKDGEEVDRFVGVTSKEVIKNKLSRHLSS